MKPLRMPADFSLRDWFLPAALRVPADALEAPGARWAARRRTQRFIALLLVIVAATSLSSIAQLAQALWPSGLAAGAAGLAVAGTLLAVRRGASVERVGALFLCALSLLAAVLAMLSGTHGVISLFWIALAPTLALSIAGPRAARAVFVFTAALITVSLSVMYRGLVAPRIDVSREPGAHIVSMLGAMSTYYALSRAYERESEASIAELERNNAALTEARVAAEAANRAKGAFLAAMSHEIRTPMNGVLGMTTVMLASELPPSVREGLVTIKQSGDTLMALLNDLLDLSRIESGRLEIEQCPVDVAAEVRTVMTLLAPFALERSNRLEVRVGDGVARYVVGDPLRVRQVLLNLVSNGLKFTRGGAVTVRVSADGDRLRLDVEDTGIGIPAEVLPSLFTPFKQADASTTRRFGGSGLGLAIVRQLVDAMGGHVSVASVVGAGSTFTVYLPARPCAAPVALARESAPPALRPLRVLVAEDNAINQKVATMLLARLGHEVTVADNGRRALEALDAGRFDLVLMDCHMPEMDGFDATLAMRLRGDRTPVVALTAASLPEERQRCFASGMADVLLKPINRADLTRVLARYGARAAVESPTP
jgi:signal transduction histidine kinase/ActR/RegA family two-component response regulator